MSHNKCRYIHLLIGSNKNLRNNCHKIRHMIDCSFHSIRRCMWYSCFHHHFHLRCLCCFPYSFRSNYYIQRNRHLICYFLCNLMSKHYILNLWCKRTIEVWKLIKPFPKWVKTSLLLP